MNWHIDGSSSDPPFIKRHFGFATVPYKPLNKHDEDIIVLLSEN